jgi:hypothetical protein
MAGHPASHAIEATDPAQDISMRIRKQDGMWEWEVRWPGPPKMRSTGAAATLREALASVTGEVLIMALP